MSDRDTPLVKLKNKKKQVVEEVSDNEMILKEKKPKKNMTPKQLENLEIGRKVMTEKKKQRLIEAAQFLIQNNVPLNSVKKSKVTREKFLKMKESEEKDVGEKYNSRQSQQAEDSESEEEEKIIVKTVKKSNKKKPKIIEIEESDSSESEEIEYKPKQKFKSQENTRHKSKIKITPSNAFCGGFI